MSAVSDYILAGLGYRHSEGVTDDLKDRLEALGARVLVGSHTEWRDMLLDIQRRPNAEEIVLIGHSLGGSVLPQIARLAGRPITAIYGFDPASNVAANISEYGLTTVPKNVKLAKAFYIPGGGLGGGQYIAEDPKTPERPNGATTVKNVSVTSGHLTVDNEIEPLLGIQELHERLRAA
jgi:hypothetical protein